MSVHQCGEGRFFALRGEALQEVSVCAVSALSRTHQVANMTEHNIQLIACHSSAFPESPCHPLIIVGQPRQIGTAFSTSIEVR